SGGGRHPTPAPRSRRSRQDRSAAPLGSQLVEVAARVDRGVELPHRREQSGTSARSLGLVGRRTEQLVANCGTDQPRLARAALLSCLLELLTQVLREIDGRLDHDRIIPYIMYGIAPRLR